MMTLTWRPMQFNLREAFGEIRELHDRLCYLDLSKLPEDEDWYKEWIVKRDERHHQLSEFGLHVSLDHAYHHLNWAWNARRTPEEQVWHFSKRAWKR